MTPPTRSTPGMARSRSASSLAKFARFAVVRYLRNCRGALNVTTFRASNPGSTRWIWAKLRTIKPAPIRSTSDSATSTTTSALRSLLPRTPPVSLPRSRSASARLPPTARSAGARPNRIAATHAAPAVYSSAATSMPACSTRGRLPGLNAVMRRIPCHARSTPSTAPAQESTTLSTSICLMMRPRPLPTAARTAISRPRSVALTQQQVRDVGARDQQHEPDGTNESEQGGPRVAHDLTVQPGHPDLQVLSLVERVDFAQARGDCVHLLLRLFHCDAVTQPRDDRQPGPVPREVGDVGGQHAPCIDVRRHRRIRRQSRSGTSAARRPPRPSPSHPIGSCGRSHSDRRRIAAAQPVAQHHLAGGRSGLGFANCFGSIVIASSFLKVRPWSGWTPAARTGSRWCSRS